MSVSHDGGFVEPEPELLKQMIRTSAAQRSDQIKIVGRGHLTLLLGLCRSGFTKVSCHADDGGPRIAEAPVDILWLSNMASDEQLVGALARFGRSLGPMGRVLVHDRRGAVPGGVRRLRVLLARQGFCLDRQARIGMADGVLLCAHKRTGTQTQQIQYAA